MAPSFFCPASSRIFPNCQKPRGDLTGRQTAPPTIEEVPVVDPLVAAKLEPVVCVNLRRFLQRRFSWMGPKSAVA